MKRDDSCYNMSIHYEYVCNNVPGDVTDCLQFALKLTRGDSFFSRSFQSAEEYHHTYEVQINITPIHNTQRGGYGHVAMRVRFSFFGGGDAF